MRNSRHSVSLGTFGLAFAVVLSPAFMQTSEFTCGKTGDTSLSVFELEVSGQNQMTWQFGQYYASLPDNVDTVVVRAYSIDPAAQVMFNFSTGSPPPIDYGSFPLGGGEVTLDGSVPLGESRLVVSVRAPGGASASYVVAIFVGCGDCDDQNECTTDWCSPPQICDHSSRYNAECTRSTGDPGTCQAGICRCTDCPGWPPGR